MGKNGFKDMLALPPGFDLGTSWRKFSRLASRIRGVPPREFPPCAENHVAMITATCNKS